MRKVVEAARAVCRYYKVICRGCNVIRCVIRRIMMLIPARSQPSALLWDTRDVFLPCRNRLLCPYTVALQSCKAVHIHMGQVQHSKYTYTKAGCKSICTGVCAAGFLKCLCENCMFRDLIHYQHKQFCCYCHRSQQETCERTSFENRVALKQTRVDSLLDNRSSCRVKQRRAMLVPRDS